MLLVLPSQNISVCTPMIYTALLRLPSLLCLRADSPALQPPGGGGEGVLWRRVFRDRQRPPHPGGHQEDHSHGGAQVTTHSTSHVVMMERTRV